MKKPIINFRKQRFSLFLFVFLALTLIGCAGMQNITQSESESLTVTLHDIQGKVQVLRPEDGVFTNVVEGQQLRVDDQLLTYENGQIRLAFSSGTIVRVSPLTTFIVKNLDNQSGSPTAELRLEVGEVWVILNGGNLTVDTSAGSATVEGSFMSVKGRLNKLGTFITCLEGNCRVQNRVGIVALIAGQYAELDGLDLPIRPGRMSPKHIALWLETNPEAEEILDAVKQTVEAYYGNDDKATSTLVNTLTPLPTATPFDCGPPEDWVLYIVKEGDTIVSLAEIYSTTQDAILNASCLNEGAVLYPGMAVFLPDVPPATATPTETPVPPATNTPIPPTATNKPPTATNTKVVVPATATNTSPPPATATSSYTPVPTSTYTSTPLPTATYTPSNTPTSTATLDPNTYVSNAIGPLSGTISTCSNFYSLNVYDTDGISFVRVQYSLNAPSLDGKSYFELVQSGSTWSAWLIIDTSSNGGLDHVYWRFWIMDSKGNESFYPSDSFYYKDYDDCVCNN